MQFRRIIPVLFILIGLGLLSYPWISEMLFENRTDSTVSTYEEQVSDMEHDERNEALELAKAYNEQATQAKVELTDPFTIATSGGEEAALNYYDVLSFDELGLMGTIEIPKISVFLPIYHGTSDEVLERGVGHLEGSSLPIGGKSCHAVLSGHTGLNSARLFTDLTALEEGDIFFIRVLDETLAYKVFEIDIVEPQDISKLLIEDGRDLVSLVTCTPYGVNSHRLIVIGERTEYAEEVYEQTVSEAENTAASSLWMQSYRNAVLIGLAIVVALLVVVLIFQRRRRHSL